MKIIIKDNMKITTIICTALMAFWAQSEKPVEFMHIVS